MANKKSKRVIAGIEGEDIEKKKKLLESSYVMYERTKKETLERLEKAVDKNGNRRYTDDKINKNMQLIQTMQNDIVMKYKFYGGDPENLKKLDITKGVTKSEVEERRKLLLKLMEEERQEEIEKIDSEVENTPDEEIPDEDEKEAEIEENEPSEESYEDSDSSEDIEEKVEPDERVKGEDEGDVPFDISRMQGTKIKYDVIPLPSGGECYKNKISKVPVGYLTAFDENMIIAPNLYKDGTFLDYILRSKIMTNKIDPDDMLPGDRDAIILWLRGSGYGTDYPVRATDPNSGKQFDTVIDLSKIKYREFKLKGDNDGYFMFVTPVTKDKIRFKFLTAGDEKKLKKMDDEENSAIRKLKLGEVIDTINDIYSSDNTTSMDDKALLTECSDNLTKYINKIETKSDAEFSHSITNRMIEEIVSINGVTDKKYISEYVMRMNVRDSSALRKYITDNTPGVDFNIKVKKPKSLGGGSVTIFLALDQYVFLNQT